MKIFNTVQGNSWTKIAGFFPKFLIFFFLRQGLNVTQAGCELPI